MTPDTHLMLIRVLKELLGYLIAGEFNSVERLTGGVRLSRDEIQQAIGKYRETLVYPPEMSFEKLDAVEVEGSNPRRWSLRFDLWTAEDGMSDLTLELTVEEGVVAPRVELDNIHVL